MYILYFIVNFTAGTVALTVTEVLQSLFHRFHKVLFFVFFFNVELN